MVIKFVLFFYFFTTILSLNCVLKFKFARVCQFFKYDERCFIGQIEFCKVLVTKRDELKCPYFICSKLNQTNNSVTSNNVSIYNLKKDLNVLGASNNVSVKSKQPNVIRTQKNASQSVNFKNSSVPSLNYGQNQTIKILQSKNKTNVLEVDKNITKVSQQKNKTFSNTQNPQLSFVSLKPIVPVKKNVSKNVTISKPDIKKVLQNSSKNNLIKKVPVLRITNSFINVKKDFKLASNLSKTYSEQISNVTNTSVSSKSNSEQVSKFTNQTVKTFSSKSNSVQVRNLTSPVVSNSSKTKSVQIRIVTNPIVSNFSKTNSVQVNNLSNPIQIQKVKLLNDSDITFTKLQNKLKTKNINNSSLFSSKDNLTVDYFHWQEISKLKNFTNYQKGFRQKVTNFTSNKLKLLKKEISFNSSRHKMEVSCPDKTCTLEFREIPVVSKKI